MSFRRPRARTTVTGGILGIFSPPVSLRAGKDRSLAMSLPLAQTLAVAEQRLVSAARPPPGEAICRLDPAIAPPDAIDWGWRRGRQPVSVFANR